VRTARATHDRYPLQTPRSPDSNSSTQVCADGQSLSPIRQSFRQMPELSHAPVMVLLTTPHHVPTAPEHTPPIEAESVGMPVTQAPPGWQVCPNGQVDEPNTWQVRRQRSPAASPMQSSPAAHPELVAVALQVAPSVPGPVRSQYPTRPVKSI